MSHEVTTTFRGSEVGLKGPRASRWFNAATVGRRSGKKLTGQQAKVRARNTGQLGVGFPTVQAAEKAARQRSDFTVAGFTGKAPAVTGGRQRRRHKKVGVNKPFNPGGDSPRLAGTRERKDKGRK